MTTQTRTRRTNRHYIQGAHPPATRRQLAARWAVVVAVVAGCLVLTVGLPLWGWLS